MNIPDFKDLKNEMERAKYELEILRKKDDELSIKKTYNWILMIFLSIYIIYNDIRFDNFSIHMELKEEFVRIEVCEQCNQHDKLNSHS